jgi:hypothetical protein
MRAQRRQPSRSDTTYCAYLRDRVREFNLARQQREKRTNPIAVANAAVVDANII